MATLQCDPYRARSRHRRPIVHEELDRLPDRQRLPVVLCDLEGLTYEQAAGRLRWTEPTLRHRLVKARRRLRERLIRRGVTAGAVGVVLAASAAGARAAVPAALARSAVAAATGGASTATAAALTATIIRSLLMTKLKIAAAGVLAAVTARRRPAFVAVGARRPDEPKPAMKAPGAAKESGGRRSRSRPAIAECEAPGAGRNPVRGSRAGSSTWRAGPSPVPGSTSRTSGRPRATISPVGSTSLASPPAPDYSAEGLDQAA